MNWKMLMCALAVSLLSTSLYAQMEGGEEDEGDEWSYALETHDHNKDGKISLDEIKKTAATEAEGLTDMEKLEYYGYYLVDFLVMDGDDDEILTKGDYEAHVKRVNEGKNGKLTAKDMKRIDSDYLDPLLALNLKEYDKDGDKAISKAEAEAMEDFDMEEFDELDGDKDGKVTTDEYKTAYKNFMKDVYDVEDGVAAVEEPEVSPEIMEKAKAAFAKWDTDKNEFVEKTEYKAAGKDANLGGWWGRYIAFLAMDTDDDLKLSFDEFLKAGLASKAGEKGKLYPVDKEEACKEVWVGLDGDSDGKVTEAEWNKAFPNSDEFSGADTDKSGDVDKDEFWTMLKPNLTESFEFMEKDKSGKTSSDPKEGEGKAGDGESNSADDSDAYAHYKKKGRSWTIKSSNNNMEIFIKTEVIEVGDDYAKIRVSMLDDKGNAFMGMKPTESKVEFTNSSDKAEQPENVKKVEKTIKVEAGEFECVGYQIGDQEVQFWMMKKYPGILVKGDKLELVEFNEE